jgi:putative zinc finger/helix-turn-helix YgiT family protein
MTQKKPTESMHGETCPFCREGKLVLQQIQYSFESPDSPKVRVPGVWVDHCDVCGENIYPSATSAYIEEFLAELDDQLTPRELERIREDLGVDQGEMSEILGLGDKTYHRWEKGTQFPSRSMGFYIRILAHHPDTFDWLKDRAWRKSNRVANHSSKVGSSYDFKVMFPNLSRNQSTSTQAKPNWNAAEGLTSVTFNF